jgi:NADH-quinone oxidoreductase subunit M
MLLPLFIIPITTLLLLGFLWTLGQLHWFETKSNKFDWNGYKGIMFSVFKLMTLVSFFVTLFYSIYLWKRFPLTIMDYEIYPVAIQLGDINLFEITNNLNLPFIILSTFVLLISLLTAWYSGVNMLLFCSMMLILEICLVGAFSCTNLFVFLLFFEASALPIFILIAYCGSARRERLKAGYYFLFYTFYGSLSLLLVLLNFYSLSQINFVTEVPSYINSYTLWILLFIAFAVKIPLFPFHIWLPYAHVEASTPTSIILAALMLKLGGYGLIKFMLPMFSVEVHSTLGVLAFALCVFGCIYSSLAALRQVDLKRYVAFSSVAHMSFATAGIFTFTEIGIKGAIYLMLSHGLTSSAMFFLVGVLSDRYHTRAVTAFSGLFATMPVFSFFFIVTSLANAGFPGTSGFIPEVEILLGALSAQDSANGIFNISGNLNFVIILLILVGMFLTTAATLLPMLRMLFGHTKTLCSKSGWVDVNKLEFYVLAILAVFMLVLGLYDILYWV